MTKLMHMGATVMCSHGGQANPTNTSARVKLGGQPAVTISHSYTVAGCPFTTPEPAPKPCTTLMFTQPASRVMIESQPAVLSSASGITIGPMGTQGTPNVVQTQTRVSGQ